MDRWARGDEIACSGRKGAVAGGCRNLAVWVLKGQYRNWISCNLHLESAKRLMVERGETGLLRPPPVVEPFQDPTLPPLTKRKQIHVEE